MIPVLADTNVLLRLMQRGDPDYPVVRAAIRKLWQRGEEVCYASQNLVEFWNVCTRPPMANGFGLTLAKTERRARSIERLFTLLEDSPAIHIEWRRLVVAHAVSGVQVHDARVVAAMRTYGLASIVTFNTGDFKRYPGIIAVHPKDV